MTASPAKSLVSIGTFCIATGFCGCAIAVLSPYSIAGLGFCAMAAFSLMQEAFIKPSMSLETRQENLRSTLKSVGSAVAWYSAFRLAVMSVSYIVGVTPLGGPGEVIGRLVALVGVCLAWSAWFDFWRHSYAVLGRGAAAVHELIADAYSLTGWSPPSPFHTRDRPAANQPAALLVNVPAGVPVRVLRVTGIHGALRGEEGFPVEYEGRGRRVKATGSLRARRGAALAAPAALTALGAFSRTALVGAS
ncbi:MAG: hypothetical protein ACOYKZ_05095 [Chlamydiia bacterium]